MELAFKIGALAGEGAFVAGRTLGRIFARVGYNVVGYPEYPSLIRGGHNAYQVLISDKKINSPREMVDVVIAVNKEAVLFHKDSLNKGGILIYDATINDEKFNIREDIKKVKIPAMRIINELKASPKMKNTVFVASALAVVDFDLNVFLEMLKEEFSRKGEEVVRLNQEVAKKAYEFTKQSIGKPLLELPKIGEASPYLSGNEAVGLGAIKAGLKVYAAYPMTPASSLLHFMVQKAKKHNLTVVQTEDEIAAANLAVGANFAGKRAMAGTSGGGFALMTETVGMAALAETPVVFFLAQRTGPSTGMPTWTEQADLFQALGASQGDFLRIILAPGNVEEAFYLAGEALNLAEIYQLPVILMSDKFLAESHFTAKLDPNKIKIKRGKLVLEGLPPLKPGEKFKRYELTEDGISPRTIPGVPNGEHVATSYEHEEDSSTTEHFEERAKQVEKRWEKKIVHIKKEELTKPKVYGNSKIAIAVWGSQLLPALDAQQMLKEEGIEVSILHFHWLFPLFKENIEPIWRGFEKIVMFENNSSSQFSRLLRAETSLFPDVLVNKYNGRPFFPEQMKEVMKDLINSNFSKKHVKVTQEKENYEYYKPWRYKI